MKIFTTSFGQSIVELTLSCIELIGSPEEFPEEWPQNCENTYFCKLCLKKKTFLCFFVNNRIP